MRDDTKNGCVADYITLKSSTKWEKAGVLGVEKGETALSLEDPFEENDNVLQK